MTQKKEKKENPSYKALLEDEAEVIIDNIKYSFKNQPYQKFMIYNGFRL